MPSAAAIEIQLTTAAPSESSTLRWRRGPAGTKNLVWSPLTSCRAPGKRELDRPRIVQKSDQVYPPPSYSHWFFQTTTTHRHPCTRRGLRWGAPYYRSGGATLRVGYRRTPAPNNAPCCCARAYGLCRTNPLPAVKAVGCPKGSTTKGRLARPMVM